MNHEPGKVIKVLHITQAFGIGGAETWLLEVARYIQRHPGSGLQIDFLLTGGEPAILDDEILQTGSKIFYLKYSLGKIFSFRKAFIKILCAGRYDAIHDHQDFVSGWHFLAALYHLPGKKVAHLHNPYIFVRNYISSPSRWFSYHAGKLLTVSLSSYITGTSNVVMDEYGYNKWPYVKKRVQPAYCGFNTEHFLFNELERKRLRDELNWPAGCRIGLFAGRIGVADGAINQKNPEFAFALAKEMVANDDTWRFLFVGVKGSQGEEMEKELITSKRSSHIRFLGQRKDMQAIMSAADVLLFPSHWEGLGMVAVEAQANGLPVVASDTLPREAIIIPELVKLKSLKASLPEWIETLQSAKRNVQQSSYYNQQIKQSPFSISKSVEKLVHLYTS